MFSYLVSQVFDEKVPAENLFPLQVFFKFIPGTFSNLSPFFIMLMLLDPPTSYSENDNLQLRVVRGTVASILAVSIFVLRFKILVINW